MSYQTNIGKIASKRILKRMRYVEGTGWVTSADTFKCRIQPKFTDAIQRTREYDNPEIFLNTIIFRDSNTFYDTFVIPTYTFPTSGEAMTAAQIGSDMVNGDRLVEEVSGKKWMVMSIAEYRDPKIKHDEVTCIEASQLDLRWIRPITLLTMSDPVSGNNYDPIRRQFTKLEQSEFSGSVEALGITEPFDVNRFLRDASNLLQRTDIGKETNDIFQVLIDDQFTFDENTIFRVYDKNYKVKFIRRSLVKVSLVGLEEYKQRGMGSDTLGHNNNRNIVI